MSTSVFRIRRTDTGEHYRGGTGRYWNARGKEYRSAAAARCAWAWAKRSYGRIGEPVPAIEIVEHTVSHLPVVASAPQPAPAAQPVSAAQEHAERPHAERSASQLGNLALCPGYRPKPAKRVHWVVAQGNRGHAALDSGDDSNLESTFEERMVQTAQRYTESLPIASKQFEELELDTLEQRWGYTDRLRIRAKLAPDGVTLVDSDEADLLDWKFVYASRVTDAEVNMQGKDYVLGIFADERFAHINTIHVHFVEVRFSEVTTATFTRKDIPRLQLEVFALLMRARDTDRTNYTGDSLTPHYDVCRFCGAAGNCVALRRIADRVGRAYDPDGYGKSLPIPEETHASKVKDPQQRAQLQDLAALMETFAASVRHHNLTASLEDEKNLPTGYEIDWAKGRRVVRDVEALRETAEEFGVSMQQIVESSTLSWGKVEQVLRENAPRGQRAKIISAFTQRLVEKGAVDQPEPTPKLRRSVTQ